MFQNLNHTISPSLSVPIVQVLSSSKQRSGRRSEPFVKESESFFKRELGRGDIEGLRQVRRPRGRIISSALKKSEKEMIRKRTNLESQLVPTRRVVRSNDAAGFREGTSAEINLSVEVHVLRKLCWKRGRNSLISERDETEGGRGGKETDCSRTSLEQRRRSQYERRVSYHPSILLYRRAACLEEIRRIPISFERKDALKRKGTKRRTFSLIQYPVGSGPDPSNL